jgi:hypothetical protein
MSRGWKVPPAPSCAAPAPTPTLLYQTSAPLLFIGHFAIDAEFLYFTAGNGVTRVSKCDGTAVTLAAPPDVSGQASSVAVSGETVTWIVLIGIGGAVLATSRQPGGVARVLASTGAPLADALAVDPDRAYFADGAVRAVPLAGGSETVLAQGWAGPFAADDDNVYFDDSPPTDDALRSVPKQGGATTVLVPAVHGFITGTPFAQDETAIYWLEWNDCGTGSSVNRVVRSGGAPDVLVSGQDAPFAITVDDTDMYWTVGAGFPSIPQALVRASKDGGPVETLAKGALYVGLDQRTVYWSTGRALMKLDK